MIIIVNWGSANMHARTLVDLPDRKELALTFQTGSKHIQGTGQVSQTPAALSYLPPEVQGKSSATNNNLQVSILTL